MQRKVRSTRAPTGRAVRGRAWRWSSWLRPSMSSSDPDDSSTATLDPEPRFGAMWKRRVAPRLTDATPATDNQIQGEVAEVAYHGLDTNLHVNTALSTKPLIVRVPSSDYDFLRLAAGMPVRLGWDARHGRVLTH